MHSDISGSCNGGHTPCDSCTSLCAELAALLSCSNESDASHCNNRIAHWRNDTVSCTAAPRAHVSKVSSVVDASLA